MALIVHQTKLLNPKKFGQHTKHMQCTTFSKTYKSYITTRRLPTKKTPKKMEKTPTHIPPNKKSNTPHKNVPNMANTPNNRRATKSHPCYHSTPPKPRTQPTRMDHHHSTNSQKRKQTSPQNYHKIHPRMH
jgi:hypothetical protein